jgi:hypothetical protein
MSLIEKIPTQVSPNTCHFSVIQFGEQEWFMNRAMLPFIVGSITSFEEIRIKYVQVDFFR